MDVMKPVRNKIFKYAQDKPLRNTDIDVDLHWMIEESTWCSVEGRIRIMLNMTSNILRGEIKSIQ